MGSLFPIVFGRFFIFIFQIFIKTHVFGVPIKIVSNSFIDKVISRLRIIIHVGFHICRVSEIKRAFTLRRGRFIGFFVMKRIRKNQIWFCWFDLFRAISRNGIGKQMTKRNSPAYFGIHSKNSRKQSKKNTCPKKIWIIFIQSADLEYFHVFQIDLGVYSTDLAEIFSGFRHHE